ncbi:MAG: M28 family peptidase [Bacteroidaceae bacterium]|nr:M28 family peptidase [Bacteroidaceae bacterium]
MSGKPVLCKLSIVLLAVSALTSCNGRRAASARIAPAPAPLVAAVPKFNADSAMSYLAAQCAFGPRVPNTRAHADCAAWLAAQFDRMGIRNLTQGFETVTFDNTKLQCYNIIGSINPDCEKRIIVCSHWDSRPWADQDPDPANRNVPVMAANDGASGVSVILELARLMQQQPPQIGVDLIFLDAEDWGPGDNYKGRHKEEYWGLGTQYWANRARKDNYNARYAILLDMVGGKGARFPQEQYSVHYAKNTVDKVWSTAQRLGYGSLFPTVQGMYVTDDHTFINRIAGIPAIDIVPCVPAQDGEASFGPTWHTVSDDFEHIDPKVIEAVGNILADVIYNERP